VGKTGIRRARGRCRTLSRANSRYEPILSQTIVASVDNALAASTPAFLESIRMTTFTRKHRGPFHPEQADNQWAQKVFPPDRI
jgi:hypothetical protein